MLVHLRTDCQIQAKREKRDNLKKKVNDKELYNVQVRSLQIILGTLNKGECDEQVM
jgi:hypothetical protein